ncbi:hypothetical protein BsWGS_02291 [Bradybaena similaris]
MNTGMYSKNGCYSKRWSIARCLTLQSSGLLKPLVIQRSLTTYFMQALELSLHKDVQAIHSGAVNDLDIDTTEHRYLLSGGSDGSLAVHDLQDLRDDEHNNGLLSSKNYKLLCSISAGNRNAHKRSIETVQWYPLDTGIFTSSGTDRVLKIWDANLLKTAEEYEFSGIVHCHHMSPIATKHNFIAVGTDSSVVKLVDPRAGSAIHSLRGHKEGAVRAVQWSNRDEFILATGGIDNFAMLWDVRTAKGCLTKFQGNKGKKKSGYLPDTTHDGSVNGLAFTADGLHLTTIGTDQKLYMWDTWTGKKVQTKFPPLSNIKKRSVKFWLTKGGSENFAFVPTGSSITSFNVSAPGKASHLYGHYNSVNCCVYHEQGNQLVSGGNDHRILVWTRCGDRDYDEYLCERRAAMIDKRTKGEETEAEQLGAQISLPEAVAQTLDTWSDDDDDEKGT